MCDMYTFHKGKLKQSKRQKNTMPAEQSWFEEGEKKFLRAGFEPATYGFLLALDLYSPPLYQLSYRRKATDL